MSLVPKKIEILETMLLQDKPTRATQIAQEVGDKFPPTMMHLVRLTKMGYAMSPEKACYVITEKGKEALGIPEVSRENAKTILAPLPNDKAFHFYAGIGAPLHVNANSLQDFCNKITRVDVSSIEFHLSRGDFEAWFKCLGDGELTKKAALLKRKKLSGEDLRGKMHSIVEARCVELTTMLAQTPP